MTWKNIRLVFLREVRDQLRDRRTLFMVAVLPLLLYPAMGLGMLQMSLLFSEQTRTVVILGADHLPETPLVQADRFVADYFEVAADAEKLHVVTDANLAAHEAADPADIDVATAEDPTVAAARTLRSRIEEVARLEAEAAAARAAGTDSAAAEERLLPLKAEIGQVLSTAGIQVLILVPEGFRERLAEINRQLADRSASPDPGATPPRLRIVRNSADEKSLIAYRRVKEAVETWEEVLLRERLASAQLPASLPRPVNADPIDLAQEAQLSANVWSKLFPALLVIMAVTGAFYPAVDLGAGEKERGTMETLLISPATRTEIVLGKFLTVVLFSLCTALLNLASMGLTGKHMLSIAGAGQLSRYGDVSFPSWGALLWVVVLAIPLAALFSSLSLGLALFARSSKEGQYYLTPLLMVTMGITVFCLSPAVEITPFYSVLPVMGPALLLKALLLAPGDAGTLYWYAVPVLGTSLLYSLLGLWWAIEQFKSEDVLFREAERLELRLWVRHLLRDKEPTPSFSEAGFCFVLIMLLQFLAMRVMGQATVGVPDHQLPARMMQLLLIQQLVIIATPALMMGTILTTSVGATFRLRWPRLSELLGAAALAVLLHPPTVELSQFLGERFFPPLPEGAQQAIAPMFDPRQPAWLVLLTFALAPGLCEELAFRGFILSGFCRSGRVKLAVVLSSVAFGVMHMFPQQVFNATLLGLVLGLLAIRSASLLPGIVFHIVYNGTEVLRNRVSADVWTEAPLRWLTFVQTVDPHVVVRYNLLCVGGCLVAALLLLSWLAGCWKPRGVGEPAPSESLARLGRSTPS